MKKVSLILLTLYFSFNLFAQDLTVLKGERKFDLIIDYSEASINGLTSEEWMEYIEHIDDDYYDNSGSYSSTRIKDGVESNESEVAEYKVKKHHANGDELWKNIQKEWKFKFLNECNIALKQKGFVGNFPKAKYQITVKIDAIDKQGAIYATIYVANKETKELVGWFEQYAKGGHFGSLVNLGGDGHEKLGKKIGQTLRYYL